MGFSPGEQLLSQVFGVFVSETDFEDLIKSSIFVLSVVSLKPIFRKVLSKSFLSQVLSKPILGELFLGDFLSITFSFILLKKPFSGDFILKFFCLVSTLLKSVFKRESLLGMSFSFSCDRVEEIGFNFSFF